MFRRASTVVLPVAVVALLAAMLWLRHAPRASVEPGACRGCNVLLVTIDTLRRDRVGAFGGRPGLTPTLDRIAGQGIRFTNAYTSVPLTLPAHTTIMTGLEPPVHGIRANGLFRLGATPPTLATILKSHGYRTGAFVGAFVLDARFGLNRGFDVYDDRYGDTKEPGTEGAERKAEDVVRPALGWIMNGPRPTAATPFFAWLHFYDPHEPYRAPTAYAEGREPYDGEVAYADAMLGRVIDALDRAGLIDSTLVIVAADHGESLGEHGERTHGVFVYEPTVRVPWVIWAGRRMTPGAYDGLARLVDLTPTTLDLLAVSGGTTFNGRSLVGAIAGREEGPASAYLEAMDANLTRNWAPLTAIVSGTRKFIELPLPELYDVSADPAETANLVDRDATRARAMTVLLRDTAAGYTPRGGSAAKVSLDTESRQRLQALGYVASSAEPGARTYTDADDPKRLMAVANDLDRALAAFRAASRQSPDAQKAERQQAMELVAGILRAHPSFSTAYGILASMQRQTGDLPGAIATLEALVRRGSADPSVITVLAGYLQEAGALDRSAALLEAVIVSHPDYADAYNSLGVVESRRGRHDRAREAFEKVLALDPTSATAYENLGADEFRAGAFAAAADDLQRAIALDPKLAAAHNALGSVYMRTHREADALEEWKTALRLDPRLYDALFNLGMSLWNAGRKPEARPYLERFVREAPPREAADVARIAALLAADR